jgi:exosortase B
MSGEGVTTSPGAARIEAVERGGQLEFLGRDAIWLLIAILVVALPTYYELASSVWATEEQSHGPVILAAAFWLLWQKRFEMAALPESATAGTLTWALAAIAAALYVLGRSQAIIQAEALGVIAFVACAIGMLRGRKGLALCWFPLFFMLFTVPLPGVLVQAVTLPLKLAVSYTAELILHYLDYPMGRSGVILIAGQYTMLVADACAGLTSIFTLEAFGLMYLNIVGYSSKLRNVLIALAVIPCAFAANVIRVCILVLITFHFGSEAGAGFVHSFAGIVLFVVAMVLLLSVDWLAGRWLSPEHSLRAQALRTEPERG